MTVRWFFTFSPSKLKRMPQCFKYKDSINFCRCVTYVTQKWFTAPSISSMLILSSWTMQGPLLTMKLYFISPICGVNQQHYSLQLVAQYSQQHRGSRSPFLWLRSHQCQGRALGSETGSSSPQKSLHLSMHHLPGHASCCPGVCWAWRGRMLHMRQISACLDFRLRVWT